MSNQHSPTDKNEKVIANLKKAFDIEYTSMQIDVTVLRNEIQDLKYQINKLEDENRRLRRDFKESISQQLDENNDDSGKPLPELTTTMDVSYVDNNAIRNLENQLSLVKDVIDFVKERDNAVRMWQQSLNQMKKLEEANEILQYQASPQTVSHQLQLKQVQEDFMRSEAILVEEIGALKHDINKKNDEINSIGIYCDELKILIENLRSQISEKDYEKRDFIKKEFGYDEAVISLQNIINDMQTENESILKENDFIREKKREIELRLSDAMRQREEQERIIAHFKVQMDENSQLVQQARLEKQRSQIVEKKQHEEHERLHKAIVDLIKEAVSRTKIEVESLKKIYNANTEKLIAEYTLLENDRNDKAAQLDKALRSKKTVEDELEKMSHENLRTTSKDNSAYEELYRRLCTCEREKDDFYNKLEAKETELKKLQQLYENEKEKVYQLTTDYKDKTQKIAYESEKLNDDRLKLLNEIDELQKKMSEVYSERDQLQKKLTKQMQISENQIQNKEAEFTTKFKTVQDTHRNAMFELRQLLNMQQRMSNKWKEECHVLTTQAEHKISEFRATIEGLRNYNDKILGELQDVKQKEFNYEKTINNCTMKINALTERVKDAEYQAADATKRMAKYIARERIMLYEKGLLENDLDRTKFNDTFNKGKAYLSSVDDEPKRIQDYN